MKRIVAVIVGLFFIGSSFPAPVFNPLVQASTAGVMVFNTPLANNTGLTFCTPEITKGCIDSVVVDGVALTPVATRDQAAYGIGGGLYSGPCQFVDTTVTQCEYPYLVVYPMMSFQGTPPSMTNVEIQFRRRLSDHKTAAINSAIVNGVLQSFSPASSGLRDIAVINVSTSEIHSASTGLCLGWVTAIDTCAIGDVANATASNRVSMLLLPGMRSSVVPPDAADPTCKKLDPTSECFIYIFDAASQGGWIDTDASIFGLTSTDRFTGAAQLKIAGPHFKAPVNGISELNLSKFRMFLPTSYLSRSFGLTPDEANATSLPVRRTVGKGSTIPATEYLPSSDGLVVSTTGIGFSTPTMTVQRVLVVKKNQKLTADGLLKAAGIFQTKKFGKAKITVNSKHGMKTVGKRYLFSKTRTVKVAIQYQSSKKTKSIRHLTVKVVS